ncbi:MAG TPA: Rossmann-like and DUF2520 domain-containing protein [Bacteroidia bacterium]|nr:Rossmann-like and DUF2520 domain-containing protein [Bacteroidia bacterium]
MNNLRCTLIGSGNVATHLGIALYDSGIDIVQVYSRKIANAKVLAKGVKAKAVSDLKKISANTDVFIIAVNDDAIASVVKKLNVKEGIVMHTSGSVSIDVLKKFEQYGVFYPLQTFSKAKQVVMSDVPVCVEGNDQHTLYSISNIASVISDFVYALDSDQRAVAHLAAVFANNFSNHLYHIADDLLKHKDLPFDLIRPLILETAIKVLDHSPAESQTGPAKRNDKKVIAKHLALLKKFPQYKKIYSDLTSAISSQRKK